MAFTAETVEQLKAAVTLVEYTLEVRSSHPESSEWAELPLAQNGFSLIRDRKDIAATLVCRIPACSLSYFDELEPANPLALFSEIRLTGKVGGATEVLFLGFIIEIREEEEHIRIFATDHCLRLIRAICAVELEGDVTAKLINQPVVALPDEFDDHTYGLDPTSTPEGFAADGSRRAWRPGDIRIYDGGEEVAPDFYRVYPPSGVVRFCDPLPANPTVGSVYCYLEGTSDAAAALAQALAYERDKGGAGIAAEEMDLPPIGTDLQRIRWEKGEGSVADFIRALSERLPRNYRFCFDSEAGKFTHELLTQKELPDRQLINVARFHRVRSREQIYTRVVVRGRRTHPLNLALNATLTDLQAGVGESFRWDGSEKIFGEGTIGLIRDGDDNSGFGRHNAPYDYEFYDFAKFDLGLDEEGKPPRISAIELTAANSKNVNSQSSANSKFSYGYELLGSSDDVDYERVSADATVLLRPLSRVRLPLDSATRFRYLKVRVKPAKDGVSNDDDPGLALNEMRILGDDTYLAEAAVQDADPDGEFYYPELLEKTDHAGPQVLLVDVGDELAETEAAKLARTLLAQLITEYLGFEAICIGDPTVRVGQTVSASHPVTGEPVNFLVERVELTPRVTRVFGTDFNAEVLR